MILDFSSQLHYVWALLPEIFLSLWAMLVLMVDVFQKGNRVEPSRPIIAWLTLIGIALTALVNVYMLGITEAAAIGMIAVDSFRIFSNFIFLLAAGLATLISMGYLDRRDLNRGEFYVLLMYATVGMMVLGASRDLILLVLALELMSVSIYNLYQDGQYPMLSAMGVILLLIVLSLALIGTYIGRRFGVKQD